MAVLFGPNTTINEKTRVGSVPAWKQQMREALTSPVELGGFLGVAIPETSYSLFIPRPLAERIRKSGSDSPLWKQFVPDVQECFGGGLDDPICDRRFALPGPLIHRYLNRALFLSTTVCPVQCRYCFRKNELSAPDEMFRSHFSKALDYLRRHPEIEEIIYSGGDPFILSSEKLEETVMGFREVSHLQHLRFHTRMPTVLPERFDDPSLLELLEKASEMFQPVSIVIHINHGDEIDERVKRAFQNLRRLPLRILTQSVLLKGINDQADSLRELFLQAAIMGATPYYLHHPDRVRGGEHFYLSRKKGREIYLELKTKSLCQTLPHYVVEQSGGEGKVFAL